LTGDWTNEIGLDDALGTATVAAHDIPVVAFFALVEDAIAATRTGIGLEASLRSVGYGTRVGQRDGDTYVPAGALIGATVSSSDDAVATPPPPKHPDLAIAGSKEKAKAHGKPTAGQAPKGPIRERKGKGHPPGPSTIVRHGIGNNRMHTILVPRPRRVLKSSAFLFALVRY
jgi:hypothetical protein